MKQTVKEWMILAGLLAFIILASGLGTRYIDGIY